MNTTMQNINSTTAATHPAMMTLDGSTRLKMAADKPIRRMSVAIAAPQVITAGRDSLVKEAVAVSLLLGLFTGAFWLLITFIRSY